MSLFTFPFFRKSLPSVGNPVFVDDILAANQLTIDGLTALTNLPNPGFAIISGLAYTAGSPGSYATGIIWLNGFFYAINNSFAEGLYILPQPTDTNNEPFSDAVSRPTYTLYAAVSTNSPAGASPVFSGNMNAYRIGNNDLKAAITAVQAIIALLGGAAYLDVGITAGTVASGNDARFGYSTSYQDANFARIVNVIIKGDTNPYTPTNPLDPVNKQYADATSAKRIVSGNYNIGLTTSGGNRYTVPLGTTLGSTAYIAVVTVNSSEVADHPGAVSFIVKNKTTTSFDVWAYPEVTVFNDITLDWIVFGD